MAKPIELKLKEGDVAPDFTTTSHDRRIVSLASFRGKNVILYFYPKDSTPGCTKEACVLRDNYAEIKNKGAVILGVSTDSTKSHATFVEKHKLPFPLLVDEDKRIVNAYGAYGPKTFMGFNYTTGTHRITFLIGPDGTIRKIWPKVNPAKHAREILAALGEAA
jgi:peroxiredoxin Q/BCP